MSIRLVLFLTTPWSELICKSFTIPVLSSSRSDQGPTSYKLVIRYNIESYKSQDTVFLFIHRSFMGYYVLIHLRLRT